MKTKIDWKYFSFLEKFYFVVAQMMMLIAFLPIKINHWAIDKLNKSYYGK